MSLKENLILKNEDKLKQIQIIQHFSNKRPQNLHMFSKAFLHMNYDHSESDVQSMGTIDSTRSVKLCATVLAKYVIEKWKLAVPIMKIQNQKRTLAIEHNLSRLQYQAFQSWRHLSSVKNKKRALLDYGREFYQENLLKHAMEALIEYKNKRQNKEILKNIAHELQSIKKC